MVQAFDPLSFAASLIAAHKSKAPFAPPSDAARPSTTSDAYAVQAIVLDALGPAGGFKTGRQAPDACQVMAPIPVPRIRPSPAVFKADELHLVGVELEIAFRFDKPSPDPKDPDFESNLRSAVSVMPAIEVVDTRLTDAGAGHALSKLADNQSNAGLVIGTAVPLAAIADGTEFEVDFRTSSQTLGSGPAKVPGGSAFAVLAGFVQMVGSHCGGVQQGHVVTTGALTGLHWIEKGTTVTGHISGLGEVSVRITEDDQTA